MTMGLLQSSSPRELVAEAEACMPWWLPETAAGPEASPERMPAALAVMVRGSEDCQANSEVTSLTEPSLKVAVAFSWVVLPMDTTAWEGVIMTDCNAGAAGLIA